MTAAGVDGGPNAAQIYELEHSLKDVDAEQPGPGDDAALARLVSSQDEICRRQQLGLSQERLGFLVAAGGRGQRYCRDPACRAVVRFELVPQV